MGGRTVTIDVYKERLQINNPNIKYVSGFIDMKNKAVHLCTVCNHKWEASTWNLSREKNTSGCPKCGLIKAAASRLTPEEDYRTKLKEKFPQIELVEPLKGMSYRLDHKCLDCGTIRKTTPSSLLSQKIGCSVCYHKIRTLTPKEYRTRLKEMDSCLKPMEDYLDIRTPIEHKCNQCKAVIHIAPSQAYLLTTGCTECHSKLAVTAFTEKAYKKKLKEAHPHIKCIGTYAGATVPIKHRCTIHQFDFIKSPYDTETTKFPCKKCENYGRKGVLLKSHKDYIKELKHTKPDVKVVGTYSGYAKHIEHTCQEHGNYLATPDNVIHSRTNGCPCCRAKGSTGELEILEWLRKKFPTTQSANRKLIAPYELDIFIPEKNIAIEYNGLYWHSEQIVGSKYHKMKTDLCAEQGIRLIHVFEDDWLLKPSVVKHMLRHVLHCPEKRLFARKLTIKRAESIVKVRKFYNQYHLQGAPPSGVTYGLFDDQECVACMSFSYQQSIRGKKKNNKHFELVRFATKYQVVGGASRLLTAFIRDNPQATKILSYSHTQWFTGDLYNVLGFKQISEVSPDYSVVIPQSGSIMRKHKSTVRHSNLGKLLGGNYDPELTERENCRNNGIYRIFDAGKIRWELKP